MRLTELKLANFRGYRAETLVPIDPLTVFIGRNDAGKSSILDALNIFFQRRSDRKGRLLRSQHFDQNLDSLHIRRFADSTRYRRPAPYDSLG